jgi:hypothetical protein
MSFKNYKKGLHRPENQALENSRHIFANYKIPLSKHPCNPWWARRRHPGWAAYHANNDKDESEGG